MVNAIHKAELWQLKALNTDISLIGNNCCSMAAIINVASYLCTTNCQVLLDVLTVPCIDCVVIKAFTGIMTAFMIVFT